MHDPRLLRRDFLRWMTLTGATASLPGMVALPVGRARAAASAAPPLFVSFEAVGAYDITMFCDPRGSGGSKPANLGYAPSAIKSIGAMEVAPQVGAVVDFFSTYYRNTLVLNGIDTDTIDHATGMRSSMSGFSATGYPVIGALAGAVLGGSLSAPFMANGGYCNTSNIVGMTQLGAGVGDALLNPMDGGTIHRRAEVWNRIQQGMADRLARSEKSAIAPQRAQNLALMAQALGGAGQLSVLTSTINDLAINVPTASPLSASLSGVPDNIALNIRVGLAGYLYNQTVALQIAVGIFDSHSNNDAQQTDNLTQLFSSVDYLLRCANHLGLSERLLVHVGSDFARTPYYNGDNNGKDHWPTTSALIINPATHPNTPVNTVIGQTDTGLNPVKVNPQTLRPSDAGVTIKPGHLHDAFRRYLGIDADPLCRQFTLHMTEQMPLLG